jgi:hypothetical protein
VDFYEDMSYNDITNEKKEECLISLQPNNFRLEPTTVWSFPDRGSWATHSGKYRGNWSPYVPRNLILRYSNPGDWVLDQFMGSGTTLVEAKLLNRNAVGVDINPQSVSISETNLHFIKDSRIDFICTHPPYANIIKYSKGIEGDMRKRGKVIPLGFRMMECFLQAGFTNKEIIIKEQHNCRSMHYWEKQNNNFLLLAHEYIFVFQK